MILLSLYCKNIYAQKIGKKTNKNNNNVTKSYIYGSCNAIHGDFCKTKLLVEC